jgi:hypothetical protein
LNLVTYLKISTKEYAINVTWGTDKEMGNLGSTSKSVRKREEKEDVAVVRNIILNYVNKNSYLNGL